MITIFWFLVFISVVLTCQYFEYKNLLTEEHSDHDFKIIRLLVAFIGPWLALQITSDYLYEPLYNWIYSLLPSDSKSVMIFTAALITFIICFVVAYSFILILAGYDLLRDKFKHKKAVIICAPKKAKSDYQEFTENAEVMITNLMTHSNPNSKEWARGVFLLWDKTTDNNMDKQRTFDRDRLHDLVKPEDWSDIDRC